MNTNADQENPRRHLMTLAVVFGVALAVRVVAIVTSTGNPSFATPITDAGTYDAVARHLWQTGQAEPRLFWQPFLYPLQLALVYAASGGSILAAKVFQAIVGSFTCGLVYLIGWRRLGRRVGLIAAGITAFYGPLILFESELLATGAAAFWGAALVLLFSETEQRRSPILAAALGAAVALAVLARPTFVPFVVIVAAWTVRSWWVHAGWRKAAGTAALGLVAFALVAVPFAAWNGAVTGHRGITPGSGGLNVHLGNNPDVCATLAIRPGVEWEDYMRLPAQNGFTGPDARDRYFYGRVKDYLRHDPGSFFAGLGRKTLQMVGSREIPRNLDVYLWRDWSPVLAGLTWRLGSFSFPFGLLLPLALLGVIWRGRRLGAPLLMFLVLYAAAVVLVFVTARYRVPLVPVLAVAAAAGIEAILEGRRQRGRAGIMSAVVVATVLLATVPGPFCEEEQNMEADLWFCLGTAQFSTGQDKDAWRSFETALAADPQQAQSHYNLGVIAARNGNGDRAARHYRDAIRLEPDFPRARNNLATLLAPSDPAAAEEQFRAAIANDPRFSMARRNLISLLIDTGRSPEALPLLDQLIEKEPGRTDDQVLRGKALLGTGNPAAAVAALRWALARGAEGHEVRLNLGGALMADGNPTDALEQFERVIADSPRLPWAHTMAGVALAELGRHEAAGARFEEALALEPRDARARLGFARAQAQLKEIEERR